MPCPPFGTVAHGTRPNAFRIYATQGWERQNCQAVEKV
jgi:hypothetical protein